MAKFVYFWKSLNKINSRPSLIDLVGILLRGVFGRERKELQKKCQVLDRKSARLFSDKENRLTQWRYEFSFLRGKNAVPLGQMSAVFLDV